MAEVRGSGVWAGAAVGAKERLAGNRMAEGCWAGEPSGPWSSPDGIAAVKEEPAEP